MSTVAGTIVHKRGESLSFGLRASTAYDGTETVACDIKEAKGGRVPPIATPVILSITPSFVGASGGVAAHWLFSLTATQTAALEPKTYVTDARIQYTSGAVDYPDALAIVIEQTVTVRPLP